MALISCPKCGNEVSDQAVNCVHCGERIAPIEPEPESEPEPEMADAELLCDECGNPVPEDAEVCPKCGCPMKKEDKRNEDAIAEAHTEESVADKAPVQRNVKSKTLLIVIAVAVVVIAAIVIGFAVNSHQEQVRQEQEAAAAQAAAEAAYNQYIDDLNESMILMISGAAEAETLGNTTRNVWNSAIFDHSEDAWDEEIRKYYSDDFNDALSKLYSDPDVVKKVSEIKSNQDKVNELYKKLQDPPEGLANAYSAYEDMHDAYVKLTRLATSPTGSLQSYNNDFRDADNACVEAYEKLKARIPEKKS